MNRYLKESNWFYFCNFIHPIFIHNYKFKWKKNIYHIMWYLISYLLYDISITLHMYHMIHYMISYHILLLIIIWYNTIWWISYHFLSYHRISYHNIIWYRMISYYDVISYDMISKKRWIVRLIMNLQNKWLWIWLKKWCCFNGCMDDEKKSWVWTKYGR